MSFVDAYTCPKCGKRDRVPTWHATSISCGNCAAALRTNAPLAYLGGMLLAVLPLSYLAMFGVIHPAFVFLIGLPLACLLVRKFLVVRLSEQPARH